MLLFLCRGLLGCSLSFTASGCCSMRASGKNLCMICFVVWTQHDSLTWQAGVGCRLSLSLGRLNPLVGSTWLVRFSGRTCFGPREELINSSLIIEKKIFNWFVTGMRHWSLLHGKRYCQHGTVSFGSNWRTEHSL